MGTGAEDDPAGESPGRIAALLSSPILFIRLIFKNFLREDFLYLNPKTYSEKKFRRPAAECPR